MSTSPIARAHLHVILFFFLRCIQLFGKGGGGGGRSSFAGTHTDTHNNVRPTFRHLVLQPKVLLAQRGAGDVVHSYIKAIMISDPPILDPRCSWFPLGSRPNQWSCDRSRQKRKKDEEPASAPCRSTDSFNWNISLLIYFFSNCLVPCIDGELLKPRRSLSLAVPPLGRIRCIADLALDMSTR